MKHNYTRKTPYRASQNKGLIYVLKGDGYYRRPKTIQEIRRNHGDLADKEFTPRRCRLNAYLNSRSLERPPARNWKKSWKDFTKYSKQWEINI